MVEQFVKIAKLLKIDQSHNAPNFGAAASQSKKAKTRDVSTQTGDSPDFYVSLSKHKHARLYYSQAYKDIVLSFNINHCKSFIITRYMWNRLRNYIYHIDREFTTISVAHPNQQSKYNGDDDDNNE